jgi:hypothetical protein
MCIILYDHNKYVCHIVSLHCISKNVYLKFFSAHQWTHNHTNPAILQALLVLYFSTKLLYLIDGQCALFLLTLKLSNMYIVT